MQKYTKDTRMQNVSHHFSCLSELYIRSFYFVAIFSYCILYTKHYLPVYKKRKRNNLKQKKEPPEASKASRQIALILELAMSDKRQKRTIVTYG
ncbi:hypothetical protein CIK88_09810 [Prevotella sp. P5-50]|nr:hypothetical protein CIK88_09810 [Prevotella sp. P5-50]